VGGRGEGIGGTLLEGMIISSKQDFKNISPGTVALEGGGEMRGKVSVTSLLSQRRREGVQGSIGAKRGEGRVEEQSSEKLGQMSSIIQQGP